MRRRWIISILCLIGLYCNVPAQNDSLNRQKYWHLRHRLVTKFIKVGPGPGESIPASKYICAISWTSVPYRVIKKLEWGDSTTDLGWYIGILATEIKLLQRSNHTSDEYFIKLLEELYYALNAINRLDEAAEIIWSYSPENCHTRIDKVEPVLWDSIRHCWLPKPGSGINGILNGYCARSDGNTNLLEFFTDAASINTGLVRTWNAGDTLQLQESGPNAGSFGFYMVDPADKGFSYRSNGYYPHSQTSQDQIFGMLMGLMLVNEYVDDNLTYHGIGLKQMGREIALRLLSAYRGWTIKNPLSDKMPICNHGGNSFPFWMSLLKIKKYFQTGKKNQVNDQILLWGMLDCKTSYMVNRSLFALMASIANTTPHIDLCRYVTRDGFDWGFYYLLRKAIYYPDLKDRKSCNYTLEEVKFDLGLCPFRGPHYDLFEYGPNEDYVSIKGNMGNAYIYSNQEKIDNRPPKWHFSNRFSQICTPNDPTLKRFVVNSGEFSGLDYLLLYNLANLVFGIEAMGGNYPATRDYYFPERPYIQK